MELQKIECLQDGEFQRMVREQVEKSGSRTKAAREIGISPQMLTMLLNDSANPGWKSLEFFGLDRKVVYMPKSQGKK